MLKGKNCRFCFILIRLNCVDETKPLEKRNVSLLHWVEWNEEEENEKIMANMMISISKLIWSHKAKR